MEKERILRPDEVTKYLGPGMTAVYMLLRNGEISSIKIQHQYRMPEEELFHHIADSTPSLTFSYFFAMC